MDPYVRLHADRERSRLAARRIVSAAITGRGHCLVSVTFDDGSTEPELLRFYEDEISFTDRDLIGRTAEEVRRIHYEKDLRYLRS